MPQLNEAGQKYVKYGTPTKKQLGNEHATDEGLGVTQSNNSTPARSHNKIRSAEVGRPARQFTAPNANVGSTPLNHSTQFAPASSLSSRVNTGIPTITPLAASNQFTPGNTPSFLTRSDASVRSNSNFAAVSHATPRTASFSQSDRFDYPASTQAGFTMPALFPPNTSSRATQSRASFGQSSRSHTPVGTGTGSALPAQSMPNMSSTQNTRLGTPFRTPTPGSRSINRSDVEAIEFKHFQKIQEKKAQEHRISILEKGLQNAKTKLVVIDRDLAAVQKEAEEKRRVYTRQQDRRDYMADFDDTDEDEAETEREVEIKTEQMAVKEEIEPEIKQEK